MVKVLELIAMKGGIDLIHGIATRIGVSASNNLLQTIHSFEATAAGSYGKKFLVPRPVFAALLGHGLVFSYGPSTQKKVRL